MALVGLALIAGSMDAQRAQAVIRPAVTIDGPSENIVGFGGIAMAADGTGGLVYLKRVEGVAHVFVARYAEGRWLGPAVRVDGEERFAASSPRIGAAEGGELVVVWSTPFATVNLRPVFELLGATLGPGSSSFGPAMVVDPDIGEGVGTSPDLAVSSTGQADVVYRAIESHGSVPLLRPGDVNESVRVAHFGGERWSRLGAINRDPAVSMRAPTQANAPQVAIGPTGNGVVVWQEPEINGVARIWARRLFGQTLDYVLPVSANTITGAPIEQDADAPSVAISYLGQAEVAYRQLAGPGSPLPGPRIFLNTLPDGESAAGTAFEGAGIADAAVAGGKGAQIGRPSLDVDERRDMRLLYDVNGIPRVLEGNDRGASGTLSLGPPFVGSPEQTAASVMNPEGGGISAWPSADPHGDPGVAIREDFPTGAVQTGLVSGGAGGQIGELAVGRSGLGDGLVAFQQGPLGDAAIVAAQITAPPAAFVISLPRGWVEPAQAKVRWAPAPSANGPLSYTVVLDGHRLSTPRGFFSYSFSPRGLGTGVHEVQLLATDIYGQAALTASAQMRIDGRAPNVLVRRTSGGAGVSVRVSDAQSGVDGRAVSVSFGDGHSAHGRSVLHHRYARGGVYRIRVHVRDKLGNQETVSQLVSVR